MDLQLKGKKAIIFGSSAGLGKAVAISLIAEGVEVCLCARNEEKLMETAKEIGAKAAIATDLSIAGNTKKLIQECIEKLGQIDILVTNTGGPAKGNFDEVTEQQWQTDFQSIWMSTVEAMNEVLPSMKERNFGRILMITSIAATTPLPGLTTSNGLRAGLSGLCRSVSKEVAKDNISINTLMPGYTNTDRLKALNLSDERVKEMVPAGRLGNPSELADLAAFLSSPRASYITGQNIAIDGAVS